MKSSVIWRSIAASVALVGSVALGAEAPARVMKEFTERDESGMDVSVPEMRITQPYRPAPTRQARIVGMTTHKAVILKARFMILMLRELVRSNTWNRAQ